MPIVLNIIGEKGKMGSRLAALAKADQEFALHGSFEGSDVAVDFSSPAGMLEHLRRAIVHKKPLVVGTTGHPPENHAAMEHASKEIPILFSPNFSLGMAACVEAAALIARRLKGACTIDIVEAHHVHKKDRPSGSALALKKAAGGEQTTIHSIRAGDIIGDHTVIFTCEGERIELKHQVHSRDAFARGALLAAKFLIGKPPGLYSIKDLFP